MYGRGGGRKGCCGGSPVSPESSSSAAFLASNSSRPPHVANDRLRPRRDRGASTRIGGLGRAGLSCRGPQQEGHPLCELLREHLRGREALQNQRPTGGELEPWRMALRLILSDPRDRSRQAVAHSTSEDEGHRVPHTLAIASDGPTAHGGGGSRHGVRSRDVDRARTPRARARTKRNESGRAHDVCR